ncbi:MAG: NAD-dependent succinate-semialdehyde dehydrogenase [Halieaceae bacterium]|jgi:succinate-semialdehyde dehydrogenase/glutarate-semialdehyde dehydrogenase|nr:NAD-dependent succinate-semialdehyde dehydrogenase [Halieaceae bacterium]MBT4853379.1 NAD-dependent succinate-semialdehyde dehydrogenase [Halieaceae bacterium]MBT5209869.1 NAD-dependent succinate-semialdehyde dehydrogenase [Halieaceae bacterium]MBT6333403.1 NAD-dependent succinate-semialdehyde dehydrogenase [Halieaceae bacterium]MBT7341148.1 NAD-dependent succinate-semialdehyde dehydrogenase [Halieaceae bacterium]
MYINGQWLEEGPTFEVYNPATGVSIGSVIDVSNEQVLDAVAAAEAAFPAWSKTTAYERSAILTRCYTLMMERQRTLAELMTSEQGKPLKAAMNEVKYAADFLLWFAEEAKRIYGETIPSARSDQRFLVHKQAVGVVAAITPWNYPISMLTRKLGPALAAGCTAVLKPAEATPLCAVAVFEILHEAGLPAGVANLITVSDPKPVGEIFCTHRAIRKLTFTGSTAVGKSLAQAAAPQLKRVSMELGGHAPFIVFDDADPVHAAKGVSLVKFLNTGQACISPNRIFVQRKILDSFLNTLQGRIEKLHAGDGMEPSTTIGPLINHAAIEKIDRQVQDAVAQGASLHSGGRRLTEDGLEKGCFYSPTLLSNVSSDMLIYREETFGPVAAVIAFDDDDDVIAMANDTDYGLAAYVYTQNLSRALRTFEELNFGIIGINDINPTSAAAPFGGMKESGLGREGAREGLEEYLETKLGGLSI